MIFGKLKPGCRPIRSRRQASRPNSRPCTPARMDNRLKMALEIGRTRLLITGSVMLMAFSAVGVRLVDLTLMQDAAEPRVVRASGPSAMRSDRADILDRNGEILATSLKTVSLFADPRKILDANAAARRLASVLPDLKEAEIAAKLSSNRGFVWLKRNLSPQQKWEVVKLGIPGIDFQSAETRVYPHGRLAAHVLGYVDIDNVGIAGIEKSFDTPLRSGAAPVRLSIDVRLQHILRQELQKNVTEFQAKGATGIILDASNAEILALSSLSDFDPNKQGDATDDERFNRATLGVYELGSSFKIFTTAMALDYGIVSMSDGYDATKPIQISRFTIRDFHAKRRWLSVPEIFIYSSNIGAAKMAADVGMEAQREFLKRLGLLHAAGIEIPEVGAPIIPNKWRPVNTMTIGYGHGMAVSPLQLSAAVAAVVNGGIFHKPTLIHRAGEARPAKGERVMAARTSRDLRRLMRMVVQEGTGRNAAAEGYLVGGKTGTAEKARARGYNRKSLISSFVGAFPMNNPRYVVLAVIDEPVGTKKTHGYATGGWVAAPVVKRVVERAAPLLGVEPVDETEPEIARQLHVEIKPEGHRLASF